MEDKSTNLEDTGLPDNLQQNNPVDESFYTADDPEIGANSTTGSGISEAERQVHDGSSPQNPAKPDKDN